MGHLAVLALRFALAIVFAGTLLIQGFLLPLTAVDLSDVEDPAWDNVQLPAQAVAFLVFVFVGVVAAQVVMVCVWRLLTMVRRGTVFSHQAFRYVDIIIAAVSIAAVSMFAIAVTLASVNRMRAPELPGDGIAPGIVLLVCIASAAIAGVALLVYVMRMLLQQAVARDVEAHQLQAELNEVI